MKKSSSPSKKPSDVVSIRTRNNGGGLLATLRRILQRRKAAAADSSASASASSPPCAHRPQPPSANATAQHPSATPGGHHADPSRRLSQMIAMLSPPKGASHKPFPDTQELKGSDGEVDESGDEDADDNEGEEDQAEPSNTKKSKDSSSKRTKGKKNRWVRQLLNQDAKKKDRLPAAARKKRHLKPSAHKEPKALPPPLLFTVVSPLSSYLTAKILLFLEVRQPAAVCVHVNKAFEAHVRAFYELHCPHPRPQRYLAKKLFNSPPTSQSSEPETKTTSDVDSVARIPERILSFLAIAERVNVSSCCQSLYRAANALALKFVGSRNAACFVECMTPERVEARFSTTSVLELEDMDAEQAVDVVRFMGTGGSERFASLSMLALRRIHEFSSSSKSETLFVQLIQVLFTDSVSHKLQTLELSDMGFEDFHYRYLAKLLYDARFPVLRYLNLSKNRFSSRFMRDWSRSFLNYRFQRLEELNIADVAMTDEDTQRFVACLENVPTLLRLCISHNFFSFEALAMLGEQVTRGSLRNLLELECSAITADADATCSLFDAFRDSNGCPKLEKVDLCGNPVTNPQASFKLSRLFGQQPSWPTLWHLDLSNLDLGENGFQTLADAIRADPESTREISYLDVSGNSIQRAMHSFSRCLLSGALSKLQFLSLADNGMEALEFELVAHALSQNCCPLLQTLDLSTNAARGEGITRFCTFLSSETARKLYVLDLSQNEIPYRGLVLLAETLSKGNCLQLQQLNIARNLDLRSVVKYQDVPSCPETLCVVVVHQMTRSFACPSLVSLQFGYAQAFVEGQAFVRDVLSCMSVEELRRRKQALFEQRLAAIQRRNLAKALRDQARCKRQCQLLRDRYDHLESEADQALRRRKKIRKSPHLMIRQEIQRLKQEKYHHNLCKALGNQ